MTKIAEGVFVEDILPTPPVTFTLNSAATTNATSVATGSRVLFSITAFNANAAVRYLKLYNKATAPVPASDRPVIVVAIPATGTVHLPMFMGSQFPLGIALLLVTGAADTDATAVAANDIKVALSYF
jgi:hypothetical protein